MKKLNLLFLFAFTFLIAHSQISFEKGFFINNENDKIECLIKNLDWKNNPTNFEYKTSLDGNAQEIDINAVREFGVYDVSRYIRSTVEIDQSSNDINSFSDVRKPVFKEETVFLKVLIEGKANLYFYENNKGLKRFFYKLDNSTIEPLVYKQYFNSEHRIRENNAYKQQLVNHLSHPSLTSVKAKNIRYNKKDLVAVFVDYNKYNGQEIANFETKKKKELFNLNIRPGINFSSLSIKNDEAPTRNADFGSATNFRFGLEAEFILPYNKNKWAIILEPTYQYFKSDKVETAYQYSSYTTQYAKVDYKSIEVPIGLRYYFFLNETSKIFINGAIVIDFSLNSKVNFASGSELEIKTLDNYAFGAGYVFKNKYSFELRGHTKRDLFRDYLLWISDYKTFSVIFGYTIF
ncbi:hypothetical protein [Carboxylicivirga sp. N1Y90]|uniref:hypothetical protein n=1 Tax=Carboxylicivirga fragile TaxID=3417571 RepID=UPI003D3532F5|nr:PorT family protein [Marinilabiliaceae bacterium N1Y90]